MLIVQARIIEGIVVHVGLQKMVLYYCGLVGT